MAVCLLLGRGNSNLAEAESFLCGLNWCTQNGLHMVFGETDSFLLQSCIQGAWPSPWRTEDIVNKIKLLVKSNQVTTNHFFREANKVTDKLASLSHTTDNSGIYSNFNALPRQMKGLLNTDRWKLPYFQVSRRKHGA